MLVNSECYLVQQVFSSFIVLSGMHKGHCNDIEFVPLLYAELTVFPSSATLFSVDLQNSPLKSILTFIVLFKSSSSNDQCVAQTFH